MKISERRRLGLEEANKELEALVYTVSHDLRAPLRTVHGMAGVVLEDYGPTLDTECAGYLNRMKAASMRMDTLITELLEYSRIRARNSQLKAWTWPRSWEMSGRRWPPRPSRGKRN